MEAPAPSGGSEYEAYQDEKLDPPALVVKVGKTELRYHLRCIDDLHAMLKQHGDWILLGSADEQKPAVVSTQGSLNSFLMTRTFFAAWSCTGLFIAADCWLNL